MGALSTFSVVADGVLVFDVYGTGGESAVPVGTGDPFANFIVYNSPFSNVFTFTVYGSAGAVEPPGLSEPVPGGKGDNDGRRRRIVKPTGLVDRKPEVRKGVDERVAETEVIAEGVAERFGREFTEDVEASGPVEELSLADIEREIGAILRKKLRTDDDEILLLMLMAVASARWR